MNDKLMHCDMTYCGPPSLLSSPGRTPQALLGVLFLLIFVVLLGIGAGAPEVLVFFGDTKGALLQYDTNLAVNTYFAQFDVKREHQLFWVDLRLSTGEEGALEETLGVGQIANINLDISFKVEVCIPCVSVYHVH